MADDPKRCPLGDRIYPVGDVPADGSSSLAVHHHDDCEVDLVAVHRRQPHESPEDTLYRHADGGYARRETGHAGPARVTTEAYRGGWTRIFGGKQEVGQA